MIGELGEMRSAEFGMRSTVCGIRNKGNFLLASLRKNGRNDFSATTWPL